MKQAISTIQLPNPRHPCSHLPHNFKVHLNILFIYQSEDFHACEMVIHVTPVMHAIMLTIEPNMF